jgi:hypothetical protein
MTAAVPPQSSDLVSQLYPFRRVCNFVQNLPGNRAAIGSGRDPEKKADPDLPGSAFISRIHSQLEGLG